MKSRMLFLLLNAVLVSLVCSGCFGGRTPSAQYYRLANPAAVSEKTLSLPEIQSLRVSLPDYLRRQEVVETSGENLMYLKQDARWGHDLGQGIREALVSRLGALSTASRHTVRLDYRFWNFSGDRKGQFLVRGICRVQSPETGRKTVLQFDFSIPYDVRSTQSLVTAHDQAVARLVKETAGKLQSWPAAKAE